MKKIIIYCIEDNKTGERYIGKTSTSLSQRIAKHKSRDNSTRSRPIIERGDYNFFEFATFLKGDADLFEKEIINYYDCVNKKTIGAGATERQKLNQKKYIANSPTILCECGRETKKYNLWRHKLTKVHLNGL